MENNNYNHHESQEQEQYQPPTLALETSSMDPSLSFSQQDSIEAALLRERTDESRSILQQMTTISAISSELNSLVNNQQGDIDEMEDNAYGVHDAAERGVTELENASNMMQKNNGGGVEVFWKFFFGVVGIGGLVIGLVMFFHSL